MPLTDNLIVFYELATNANDSHNVGPYNLTAQGTPTFPSDYALLDGTTDYFTRADNADISTGDIDYTWNGWVYLDTTGFSNILAKWGALDANKEFSLRYHNGVSAFQYAIWGSAGQNTCDASTFGAASATTWYMVTFWHDSVNNLMGIAVNAGTADTVSYSNGSQDGGAQLEVGNGIEVTGSPMNGRLRRWGFWKRVLTSQERTDLYAGGSGLSYAQMSPAAAGGAIVFNLQIG